MPLTNFRGAFKRVTDRSFAGLASRAFTSLMPAPEQEEAAHEQVMIVDSQNNECGYQPRSLNPCEKCWIRASYVFVDVYDPSSN